LGFDFQRRICAAVKQPPFAVPVRSGSYQMCRGDRQPKTLTAPGIPKRVRVFLNSSNTTGPHASHVLREYTVFGSGELHAGIPVTSRVEEIRISEQRKE